MISQQEDQLKKEVIDYFVFIGTSKKSKDRILGAIEWKLSGKITILQDHPGNEEIIAQAENLKID